MEPRPDLDALIAERIMGWHVGKGGARAIAPSPGYEATTYWYDADGRAMAPRVKDVFANLYPWSPTTDIAAAWQVVERMRLLGWTSAMTDLTVDSGTEWWSWHFDQFTPPPGGATVQAQATSPMLAISLAALKALGVEV